MRNSCAVEFLVLAIFTILYVIFVLLGTGMCGDGDIIWWRIVVVYLIIVIIAAILIIYFDWSSVAMLGLLIFVAIFLGFVCYLI